MMIKYKVSEVAKDFNASNKDVTEALQTYLGVNKKPVASLNENELNLVFEVFTKETQVSSFDTYFSLNQQKPEDLAAQQAAILEQLRKASEQERKAKEEKERAKAEAAEAAKKAAEAALTKKVAEEKAAEEKARRERQQPQNQQNRAQQQPQNQQSRPSQQQNQQNRPQQQNQQNRPQQQNQQNRPQQQNQQSRPQQQQNQQNRPQQQNQQNRPQQQNQQNRAQESQSTIPPSRQNQQKNTDRWQIPTAVQQRTPSGQKTKRPFQGGGRTQQATPTAAETLRRQLGADAPATVVTESVEVKKPEVRTVDTRSNNVDIERYNEKYDNLAQEKVKTENTVRKQKINQRSAQRGRMKSKKETEAERLRRIAMERKTKPITVVLPETLTVTELALKLKATVTEVIKKLIQSGVFLTANDQIDFDTASLVAMEFHAKVEKEVVVTIEERIIDDSADDDTNLITRAPVVVVMGHVDHGKTSLLDAIRNTSVTAGEFGGITQHIGAYRVNVNDREITFLDTPGHEAFTTMRARGAQVTDIAILVVAADDGIMPQTVEAINHAKAAGVSIIVAINKMDKPSANPDKVMQQLTEYELVPEEWGGDVSCIPVSAKTRQGVDDLLEMVVLVADMKELRANPDRSAKGTVVEARLDRGRGPIATILVQNGTLRQGDIVVAGTTVGRVRAMTDDKGEKVMEAGPSVPVEITGLDEVPTGGDVFNAVSDERLARELVEQRKQEQKENRFTAQEKVTLENLFQQLQLGDIKELKIIVKADVQGSAEAVRQSLEKISNEEVRVNVIHCAVGAVNESDVMLASASNAIIVGFNVRPEPLAQTAAEQAGVQVRMYNVIYHCIEEITSAMKGMLAPKYREVHLGRAECRTVFRISSVGTIAGSHVQEGKITRNANIRVVRDGIVIFEDKLASLRRMKDDVKEVATNYECGIGLERFNDIKEGDIFEAYIIEEYRPD